MYKCYDDSTMIIIAFAGTLEFVNHIMMGYALVWMLVVVSILRTVIFYIMDVKDIEWHSGKWKV